MRISCPFCGERSSREFTYLGDATLRRPAVNAADGAWYEYVYLRENPAGPHNEYWQHHAGCRAWLIVRRDTTTHAILGVTAAPGAA